MTGVALVTGTSTGIGLAAAVELARAGLHVVATMRTLTKAAALGARAAAAGLTIQVKRLDVQDQTSINECLAEVLREHGRLDLVVNNAGAGYLGTTEDTPLADLQRVMDVNFYGVWRVTQTVLPVLRAQGRGRIITVTSVGGLIGQPFNDAYCAAKFAVEGWMESLAPVAQRLGIDVCLVEPGPVNTEFVAGVAAEVEARGQLASAPYLAMAEAYRAGTVEAFAKVGQTPEQIAEVIVAAASADRPHLRWLTSDLGRMIVSKKYVDPTGDSVLAITGARLPARS